MAAYVAFEKVLKVFESHGWRLQRISKPYRVFVKDEQTLPFLIPVHDKKVDIEYVQKVEKFFEEQD